MPPDSDDNLRLEIGHVLFIDIVGYSKLLIEEQKERLNQLTEIVLATAQVREASEEQLVRLPTGDGMALVFHHSAEEPARCALEIAEALRKHPELPVRMGIHSGPVSEVTDVSGRTNIAGAGINMAQRVMDCGDAGHILLSQHVADDLMQYRQWAPRLHDLGDCEVKHGVRLHLVNLYAEPLGNGELPSKLKPAPPATSVPPKKSRQPMFVLAAAAFIGAGLIAFWFIRKDTGPPATVAHEKSVAVLPFDNMSRDPDNAFFTDGVQDQILTALAKVADLKVISRTSVMQYKSGAARNLREIGQQLGVAHLLEGSVQRAGNKVRVNAQLINARTDAHEWAENYDRPIDDVFAIQSEIAKAIADQLQAKLSPKEKAALAQPPTADVVAFDLYSRARTLLLSTSFSGQSSIFLKAVDLLNQAVARDPSFFLAYCQLASAHGDVYGGIPIEHTPARLALIEAAVQAAFRLRPDAGEAHLARADMLYRTYRDYDGALAELEIARRTMPNAPDVVALTGYILRRRGKQEEGLQHLLRARELDPRNSSTLQQIALSYWKLRRYAEMAATLDSALALSPNDVTLQVARAAVELDWKADTRPLHEAIDSIRRQNPAAVEDVPDPWFYCALAERDPAAAERALAALGENTLGDDAVQFPRSFGEGLIARMMNDPAKARAAFTAARAEQEKAVQAQPEYGPALCVLAVIDAGLGRKDEALGEGRRAMELLPVEKDSINGAHIIEYFALIAAWVGEKELACEHLEKATRLSGYGVHTYGQLKLSPYWDPLRGDPRFEAIVASLAPKDAK